MRAWTLPWTHLCLDKDYWYFSNIYGCSGKSRGQLGAALHLTQCTSYGPSLVFQESHYKSGAYYQTMKFNYSLPTSRLHVGEAWLLLYGRVNWGPAWAHIGHNSYQLGRGTISPLSLFAFSIALKWGSILSGPVLFEEESYYPRLLLSHSPNTVPPSSCL